MLNTIQRLESKMANISSKNKTFLIDKLYTNSNCHIIRKYTNTQIKHSNKHTYILTKYH